jgi:4a-hydroxytetrahydrobiopterin dehydratase
VPDVLDSDAVAERLAPMDGWTGGADRGISKTFECGDFNGSVAFVNRVAEIADEADHHPDVTISWDKVTLTYVTHSAGGVTVADFDQAATVDERLR